MSSIKFGTYSPPEKEDLMQGNEVSKPLKEHQFFHGCYVTDMNLHDGKYAVTVVMLYDLKRYFEIPEPMANEKIYRDLDIVAVGIDGNGNPRIGWHEKQLFEEVRTKRYRDGEKEGIMDNVLGTGITMEEKKVSMFPAIETLKDKPILAIKQKANHKSLEDNLFNKKKLLFGADKEINLSDAFVSALKEISKFTRENDTTFPYAVINKKIQDFDNIRTGIGLVSNILPIGKAYKMAKTLASIITESIGGSPLVVPATDFYDLRGPVNLSKVTYQMYDRDYGQNSKPYYFKRNSFNQNDEIIIKR